MWASFQVEPVGSLNHQEKLVLGLELEPTLLAPQFTEVDALVHRAPFAERDIKLLAGGLLVESDIEPGLVHGIVVADFSLDGDNRIGSDRAADPFELHVHLRRPVTP